ncbi:coiled-coil domain-containing protein 169-like isoform X2 [Pomacea canaliculata]|uniref:coiled-coil domain-containing protein 169-like isoform X2 n=1 Tax=Pomacea canaliculata TaxID=400727 RepID=UPI000D73E1A2|nr:coiled-coil domain-containing protein 169-like isoform X2 [Pomacea canaliculata]
MLVESPVFPQINDVTKHIATIVANMAGGDTVDDFELEKLRAEILQEKQMKEMLDQSAAELKATIDELEKRFDSIENEGNEWKTRYETQQEMNQQLERQIILLQNKVEEARHNLKEANKTPRDNRNFDDLSDASPQMVKALDREKQLLHNQLRDLEWRLDQESKAYHKANDERKQYVLEINAAKGSISEMKTRQRQALMAPGQPETGSSPRTYRDNAGNIPDDQRIIDPRRGPIKRTAGVKSLPSLEAL